MKIKSIIGLCGVGTMLMGLLASLFNWHQAYYAPNGFLTMLGLGALIYWFIAEMIGKKGSLADVLALVGSVMLFSASCVKVGQQNFFYLMWALGFAAMVVHIMFAVMDKKWRFSSLIAFIGMCLILLSIMCMWVVMIADERPFSVFLLFAFFGVGALGYYFLANFLTNKQ